MRPASEPARGYVPNQGYIGKAMRNTETEWNTVLQRMTPDQRWRVAESLYWEARAWKVAALKALHPEWPEAKVHALVREQFLYGTTA